MYEDLEILSLSSQAVNVATVYMGVVLKLTQPLLVQFVPNPAAQNFQGIFQKQGWSSPANLWEGGTDIFKKLCV